MIHYVCKYTPLELFKGFGEECAVLEEMPENFELSDQIAHANLCGFGKSVIQAVLEGKVEQLVLVNCCDSMRRVYDIVESTGKCKFLYMLDMPHEDNDCEKVKLAQGIHRLLHVQPPQLGRPRRGAHDPAGAGQVPAGVVGGTLEGLPGADGYVGADDVRQQHLRAAARLQRPGIFLLMVVGHIGRGH